MKIEVQGCRPDLIKGKMDPINGKTRLQCRALEENAASECSRPVEIGLNPQKMEKNGPKKGKT